jgi:hypothetical protein
LDKALHILRHWTRLQIGSLKSERPREYGGVRNLRFLVRLLEISYGGLRVTRVAQERGLRFLCEVFESRALPWRVRIALQRFGQFVFANKGKIGSADTFGTLPVSRSFSGLRVLSSALANSDCASVGRNGLAPLLVLRMYSCLAQIGDTRACAFKSSGYAVSGSRRIMMPGMSSTS